MIDIHTHILPCIDDGSSSLENSIEMVKEEVRQGVNKIILTPHYRGSFLPNVDEVTRVFNEFKERVAQENIDVELFLGQEIYVTKDIKKIFKAGKTFSLAGSKFVLIEFAFARRNEISEIVHELRCEGLRPIIAHPERYEKLTVDDIYEIKLAGGFMQVNADSIVGDNKRFYKKTIKNMFREGFVDFVASDIHFNRVNRMAEAYKYVKRKFGDDAAEVTFKLNAERILKG